MRRPRGPPRMCRNVAGTPSGRGRRGRGPAPRVGVVRIGMVTREWPPDVYGGAGVHVEHLVAALRSLPAGPDIDAHCFGAPRADATGRAVPPRLSGAHGAPPALGTHVGSAAPVSGGAPVASP